MSQFATSVEGKFSPEWWLYRDRCRAIGEAALLRALWEWSVSAHGVFRGTELGVALAIYGAWPPLKHLGERDLGSSARRLELARHLRNLVDAADRLVDANRASDATAIGWATDEYAEKFGDGTGEIYFGALDR